jgi:hypothetical protein
MIALWAAPASTSAPSCRSVYLESADHGNLSRTAGRCESIDDSIDELRNLMGVD